ncbi:MAG TPA: hypothetical protein VNF72_04075 [Myxococcota bacterium]|nr:hypothetical protein [Myxococcota bacterium]
MFWKRVVYAVGLGLALAAIPGVALAGGGHGHGHGHGHGGSKYSFSFGFGPYWGGPWWYGPGAYYPHAYGFPYPYSYPVYPAPIYAPAPRVVVEEPVYVERDAAPVASGWWYYCESAGAYYPDVPSCDEPWLKVPPRAE